jgi:hypothetical protein
MDRRVPETRRASMASTGLPHLRLSASDPCAAPDVQRSAFRRVVGEDTIKSMVFGGYAEVVGDA